MGNPRSEAIFESRQKWEEVRGNLVEQGGVASLHSQWHFLNWGFWPIFILDRELLFLYVHPTGRLISTGIEKEEAALRQKKSTLSPSRLNSVLRFKSVFSISSCTQVKVIWK